MRIRERGVFSEPSEYPYYIKDYNDRIEIGAMTTYRAIETSPVLNSYFNGILSKSVAPIVGVQFRNVVTVGGSVYSRFGFSDFLTPLLALDAKVKFYHKGEISLNEFMNMPYEKDILEKIIIPKNDIKASYQMLRNAEADFPIVNLSVAKTDTKVRRRKISLYPIHGAEERLGRGHRI